MDTHDVARERGTHAEVLGDVTIPALVVGVSSDLLYPLTSQQELSRLLPLSTLEIIDSEYGHDAFLIEFKKINNAIKRFRQTLQTVKNSDENIYSGSWCSRQHPAETDSRLPAQRQSDPSHRGL